MGKQKRNRRKLHKENPTGLVSVKDFDESTEDVEENRDSALQTVCGQLQSPSMEEKLSALQTVESMCCDKGQALLILDRGLAKIIGPLLVDSYITVRAASASALRRLGENGGEEAYEVLLQDDVMTPLTALLKKYYSNWQPNQPVESTKGRMDDEKETLIEAITLLWSLCENSECIMKYSNEEKLVSLLVKLLDHTRYGSVVSVVAAQCMLTLTEDNPSALEELKEHEQMLLSVLNLKSRNERESSEIIPLKTLTAGLLMNLNNEFTTKSDNIAIMCKVMGVLAETLAIDHKSIIVELASMLPSEKGNLSRSTRFKLQAAKKILGAQQQALEILTNLCSDEQDYQLDTEFDDSDQTEYENEYMDDDPMTDKPSCKVISNLPVTLIEVITSTALNDNIIDKILAPDKSVIEQLNAFSDCESVIKQIHTLRCRAFLCLNNLIASLDVDIFGGVEQLYRLWLQIGTIVFHDCEANDIELLESATAAMRAVVQKLAELRANTFEKLTIADIEPMLNGERHCTNPNIRVNLIRMLGNVALIISPSIEYSGLVKHVSTSLLDICIRETEVWVMAEALDAIMDIFAEDETDLMAEEIKLLPKLHSLVPILTNKIRQQRKNLGDHTSVVSTVKTNLSRFIKYKERQLAKLNIDI
ncbi:HEAT repeat-containing protein 3 isoform X2 [Venturia canescens]|uniref:HEAT repeat-containing protein 3 isoform X2 n=1 Tax=Venturia canescens TaxID=32260 RepID=UPI001C9BD8E2|nr:HEAT repeat-containing protein 3 isoform X2 [Venturia canescens]